MTTRTNVVDFPARVNIPQTDAPAKTLADAPANNLPQWMQCRLAEPRPESDYDREQQESRRRIIDAGGMPWNATLLHRSGGDFLEAPTRLGLARQIAERMIEATGGDQECLDDNMELFANCLRGKGEVIDGVFYVNGAGIPEHQLTAAPD